MDNHTGIINAAPDTSGSEDVSLLEISQNLLLDARSSLEGKKSINVPIAALASLGAGVSSLIPALNTVTQTTTTATDGLYVLANANAGDVLKVAKNGNYYGALKTTDGTSKLAQLKAVDSISATTQTVAQLDPATMMMAVALFSIEQEIKKIEETSKQILSFLEIEKESEIEADIETLMGIVRNFKSNWDNPHFVSSNHKMVLDIQRTARKNMLVHQKRIPETLGKKQLLIAQTNVNQALSELEKKFKYYRLSLYTFSLSSLMEIMLSGNYKESYIKGIKDEIGSMSENYRSLFGKASHHIEKLGRSAMETSVLKGVGTAGKAVGKLIGSIPLIRDGQIDEYLQDKGADLEKNASAAEKDAVHRFATISNPGTHVFMNKMDDIIQIYNHTEQICFDDSRIYLVSAET